jgi:RNA polymerase sigma-70 factor (ECF subfamily)
MMVENTDGEEARSPGTVGGFEGQFEQTVLPLAGELYRYALFHTRNRADAEDLVQETMFKAFMAFDRLREDTNLLAWLRRIMKNTWISNCRARQHRPSETLVADFAQSELSSIRSQISSHTECSAEHQALRDVTDDDVYVAMAALPIKVRETVYHIAIVGMNCREVADAMGVPPGTVMSRMHRGRHQLRRELSELVMQRRLVRGPDIQPAA